MNSELIRFVLRESIIFAGLTVAILTALMAGVGANLATVTP